MGEMRCSMHYAETPQQAAARARALDSRGLREGDVRIPAGCAIAGIMDKSGARHDGRDILKAIALMHDRSNGLGGGFAAYGIYPEYADFYAFHVLYESHEARMNTEAYLNEHFLSEKQERIPTATVKAIKNPPDTWRYFLTPHPSHHELELGEFDEQEYVMQCVFYIDAHIDGAFVASSGKNMGAFKGVGYPEEIGEYYRIDEYEAWLWTAHGRFPTNTPGWWGGAHPFTLLDISVVHNGEISSYDANRRCMEMHGYDCKLLTDTEVIAYMLDYLVRRQGLTWKEAAAVVAAPFWSEIDRLPEKERKRMTLLRNRFSSLLITGPFSILVGFEGGMMALNDRLKLRSMVAAETEDIAYVASEECAIRVMAPDVTNVWSPRGGEPVIFTREGGRA